MATTGYTETAWAGGNFAHGQNSKLFYSAARAVWYASRFNSTDTDWFLWENGAIPGSQGADGNWTKAQLVSAGGAVILDGRTTSSPSVAWDEANNTLHVFQGHPSAEQYGKLTLNTGTGEWTSVIANEAIGSGASGVEDGALMFDTNGWAWVVWCTTTTVRVKCRTTAWQADLTVDTPGGTLGSGVVKAAISRFWDSSGNAGICIAYTAEDGSAVEGYKFAYRLDSQAHNAAWTAIETIVAAPTNGVDGHISIQAAVLPGDTEATVWVVTKGVVTGIYCYRRAPGGTWSAQSASLGGWTRPRVCIDESNAEVYLSGHASGAVRTEYYVLDASADPPTSGLGSASTCLEDNGVTTAPNDHDAPAHPVTSDSGWMVATTFSGTHWWNLIDITAPPSGGGPLVKGALLTGLLNGGRLVA